MDNKDRMRICHVLSIEDTGKLNQKQKQVLGQIIRETASNDVSIAVILEKYHIEIEKVFWKQKMKNLYHAADNLNDQIFKQGEEALYAYTISKDQIARLLKIPYTKREKYLIDMYNVINHNNSILVEYISFKNDLDKAYDPLSFLHRQASKILMKDTFQIDLKSCKLEITVTNLYEQLKGISKNCDLKSEYLNDIKYDIRIFDEGARKRSLSLEKEWCL